MAVKDPKDTPKKYARRRIKNGKVVYVDVATGKVVKDLSAYTILSGNDRPNDIYFGTDKPLTSETDEGTAGGDEPTVPNSGGSNRVYGEDNDTKGYDKYMNNDPAQGLKPKGTILGGIINNAIKDALPDAKATVTDKVASLGGGIFDLGKKFGLFGGNETVNPDGTVTQTPAIDNILDHGSTGPKTAYAPEPSTTPGGPGLDLKTGELEDNANQSNLQANGYSANKNVMDVIRTAQQYVDFPIKLTSGYRSTEQNKKVNGAKQSQHLSGNAVDISLAGLNDQQRTQLVRALTEAGANRLGAYSGNTGLHLDMSESFENDSRKRGTVYPMFDRSADNMGSAPKWFTDGLTPSAPTPATAPIAAPPGAPVNAMDALLQIGKGLVPGGLGTLIPSSYAPETSPTNDALGAINAAVQPTYTPGDPNSDPVIRNYLAIVNRQEGSPRADQGFGYTQIADLSQHPNQYNAKYDTSAAGLYQINYPTWHEFAGKTGVTDFSPESQNKVAWQIAKENYATKTGGGDLYEVLKGGDPKTLPSAFYMNRNRWVSLPKTYLTSGDLVNEYLGMNLVAPMDNTVEALAPTPITPPKPINPPNTPFNGETTEAPKPSGSGFAAPKSNNAPASEGSDGPLARGSQMANSVGAGVGSNKPYTQPSTTPSNNGFAAPKTTGAVSGFQKAAGAAVGTGSGFATRTTSNEEGKKGIGGGAMI